MNFLLEINVVKTYRENFFTAIIQSYLDLEPAFNYEKLAGIPFLVALVQLIESDSI
jgi:hypothetical protein